MSLLRKKIYTAAVCLVAVGSVVAQYPDIPKDVQQKSDSLMRAANRHSDSAWQVAWPIIQKEAREGKPYIPWASRVDELPQSNILAFPGAEGGGRYSFGGRGGKVYVVTNLNDDGPGSLRWACEQGGARLSLIHISEPTRPY